MQKGSHLKFSCCGCLERINFSLQELEQEKLTICCQNCQKKYSFDDETLLRHLKKFCALCDQIKESEEILSHTNVGIDIGEHHVKIPYKLLLTRLNSQLELKIGADLVKIEFRTEPLLQGKLCQPS